MDHRFTDFVVFIVVPIAIQAGALIFAVGVAVILAGIFTGVVG